MAREDCLQTLRLFPRALGKYLDLNLAQLSSLLLEVNKEPLGFEPILLKAEEIAEWRPFFIYCQHF